MLGGTSCALNLDPGLVVPEENAAGLIQKGDVMFIHYNARERHGFPAAESKIYWAYDRYCMPRTPGKMTPEFPNVFAEFVGDTRDFFNKCEDTFLGGQKPLTIVPLQE